MAIEQYHKTESEATTYAAQTVDSRTGVTIPDDGYQPDASPPLRTVLARMQDEIHAALHLVLGGAVFKNATTGADIDVKGLRYAIGGTTYTLADEEAYTVTLNQTNYVWCDTDEAVEHGAAWPGTSHYKLAVVVCDATKITSIVDARAENYGVGATNEWSTVAATQDVDMDDNSLTDVEGINFTDWTELTIAAGSITKTQFVHRVDGEGDLDDNLDTIAGGAEGDFLFLLAASVLRTITVRSGEDNIQLSTNLGNHDLNIGYGLLLMYTGNTWYEVSRGNPNQVHFADDVTLANYGITGIGNTRYATSELTIAAGSITAGTRTLYTVDVEGGVGASDDLDTIAGGTTGDIIILSPESAARVVTVKHNTGNIHLANGIDFEMDDASCHIGLRYDGADWNEIFRSPMDAYHLNGTTKCIPYAIGPFYIEGALATKVYEFQYVAPVDMIIKNAIGRVDTAPAGTPCIVDIRVAGVSMFADQSEMINIAAAAFEDTSATKHKAVTAGQVITIECEQHSGAEDMTIVLNAHVAVANYTGS